MAIFYSDESDVDMLCKKKLLHLCLNSLSYTYNKRKGRSMGDGGWLNFAGHMAKSKRLARGYQVQATNLNKKKFPFV